MQNPSLDELKFFNHIAGTLSCTEGIHKLASGKAVYFLHVLTATYKQHNGTKSLCLEVASLSIFKRLGWFRLIPFILVFLFQATSSFDWFDKFFWFILLLVN